MILRFLSLCAEQSRLLLVLGLILGVAVPDLSAALSAYLPEMVAILLMLSAFRVGAREAFGALGDLGWSLPAVLVLQVGIPVALAVALIFSGLSQSPLALAVVLATAAPTLSGGASLAIILRQDPSRMVQMLILGTAAFPVTILIVLSVYPLGMEPAQLVAIGLRALGTITVAAGVGFALRAWLPLSQDAHRTAVDGAVVLFFALIVIGLMAALNPVLKQDSMMALSWLVAAFALSFGLQALTITILRKTSLAHVAGPLALAAGNRNIALFLVALPPEKTAQIMLFVACWQVPMYLTPLLLGRLYACAPTGR